MKLLSPLLMIMLLLLSCETEKKQKVGVEEVTVPAEKIAYWDTQRKGTNYFNQYPTEAWFQSADAANIKFVRLVYDKWAGAQEYFLMGSADNYTGIIEPDFAKLKTYLDYANTLGIKVVICPISIPGEKWSQSNNGQNDGRLWKEADFLDQVAQFWQDLASRLKDHPAVVGYNLVNEPHPEIYTKKYSFWNRDLADWYATVKDTPADLNRFNQRLVAAIRRIDAETPIIVETGLYATPWAIDYLTPLADDKIIYSFHMYEPYGYTTKRLNEGKYNYPGEIPLGDDGDTFGLNKASLTEFFEPVREWTAKHNIPANRIWVGEFGCNRHVGGVENYLNDLVEIFNEENWHWSFYAYREDTWEAMDYELGTARVFYKYWEYQEANALHLHYDEIYDRVKDKALWEVFQGEFK